MMIVSFCVVALNEEKYIQSVMADLLLQDYPHDKIEVVWIDSGSTDSTVSQMKMFQQQHEKEFYQIQLLNNPKRIQATGWNVAIANFTGDVLLRIDAHSKIPSDFVRRNVENLERGEMVSGGVRPNIIEDGTPWKSVLLLAESSMFGSSFATYRRKRERSYVKSFFHGAYRRQVIEDVGMFNSKLGRTEDNEFHYRIRKAGYQLSMDPDIISYQYARPSLGGMLKQKYGNGYWIGLTLGVCPQCLSLYHFVPFCFFIGILFTSVLAIAGYPQLAILMWGLYLLLDVLMSVVSVRGEKKHFFQLLLPVLFFLLHISYGVGTFLGLLRLPLWKKKYREEDQNE